MNYILLIPIAASFFTTLFLVPRWIKRAKKADLVGKDLHKLDGKSVAESGGMNVIAGFVIGNLIYIAINTFIFKANKNFIEMLALLNTIILISFIAFTDDILGWKIGLKRRTRLILVVFASIPLIAINAGKSSIGIPFVGSVDVGILYPIILIPLGIAGATTTFNFLAGYNGLEAGQGIIILGGICLVAYLTGNSWLAFITACMIVSLLAFIFYNFYPAKVFPGDSLTYPVGALIAAVSILGNFEKIAIFFFIPYILETLLKLRGKLVKESYGRLLEDGTLDMPYEKVYGLEHLAIFAMKKTGVAPTERKVVFSIWAFQILIIALGLLIFKGGIFG